MKVSIVVPAYNEMAALPLFYEEVAKIFNGDLKEYEAEILFVDDGSRDDTLKVIKELHEKDGRVGYVSFSRNFGKEAAIYAGLEHSTGDYVTIMDADLQDPPTLLPDMIRKIEEEGYDCVGSRRVSRKGEPPIRSFFARRFYSIMKKISSADVVDGARDYQLMRRDVVDAILSMKEYNRFSKGIFGWVGFKKTWIEFENVERAAGETKWSFFGLLLYAIDGIIAFSTAPLVLSSLLGLFFCFISLVFIIFIIVRTLLYGDPTSGWPSMVCIIVFVAGVQLLCMGIIGQYMAKTYLETKNRPIYISKEAVTNRKD